MAALLRATADGRRVSWFARLLGRPPAQDPEDAAGSERLYTLGLAADAERRGDDAVDLLQRAVRGQPDNVAFWCALGAACFRTRRLPEAVDACRSGLAVDPGHVQTRANLAFVLLALGDFEAAMAELERVRAEAPDLPGALSVLGYVQCQLGRNAQGIATLRAALQIRPDDAEARTNLLISLNYSADISRAEVFAEHRYFGNWAAQPVARPRPDLAWPRRLRVGYVSPDFNAHVVATFMWPILAGHDRQRFEVFCYYSNTTYDDVTQGLRSLAEHWVDCAKVGDAELAARIRGDRIDILVDLAGHTAKSRLRMFALRPAPVQITYLGYPNTSGLPAIDFRISDERADPSGEAERYHVERLLRLPRTFLCYRPGADSPDVVPPAAASAEITFGCFNNFQKLSPPFFAAAARILQRVPASRLLLKARPLSFPGIAAEVRRKFVDAGIDPRRVELRGWEATVRNHLAAYGEVDIALDSFPYNGTTTTCEAMWMGVPVVTLRGDRHAARVGSSLLHAMGLDELVAADAHAYVEVAAGLAADPPRLAALRAGMRQRLRASPLMDEAAFVRDLEESYLDAWQARVAEAGAPDKPPDIVSLTEFWNACHATGQHAAAIDMLGQALSRDDRNGRLHYMLGCTLQDVGRTAEAIESYRRAVQHDAGLAKAHNNLGCLLEAAGDLDGAAHCYDRAVEADGRLAHALYNRGNAHKRRGDAERAEADFRRALALEPRHADWQCNLGEALAMQGKPEAAAAVHREALEIDPADARARFGLGNALLMMGLAREAAAAFRRAVELQPDFAEAHSNLLLAMHYEEGDDARVMHDAHREWARRHTSGLPRMQHARPRHARSRPLNIGYVSPNFQQHAVAWAIEPVLAAHDRESFRLFFYANVPSPDAVTQRFAKLCHVWRDIHALPNEAVARGIRDDRIDILVDLAGHTAGGRPLVFAHKPAPVQVNWQGYPNTTGLAEMDYRVTDEHADPAGKTDQWHVEELLRLPCGFFCYGAPPDAPDTAEPPLLRYGAATFGCFNNLAKVTPATIALWARILLRLPQARMVMKAHALSSQAARERVHGHFASHGVSAGRVELLGLQRTHGGHLAKYGEIDVALDPFPYHGTATTCEALWMGVPVVSLAGRTHVARVGVSILERVGLAEMVAADEAQYVEKAVLLASDAARLRELRSSLRERLRASPLLDGAALARALEGQYRAMWQRWCSSSDGVDRG